MYEITHISITQKEVFQIGIHEGKEAFVKFVSTSTGFNQFRGYVFVPYLHFEKQEGGRYKIYRKIKTAFDYIVVDFRELIHCPQQRKALSEICLQDKDLFWTMIEKAMKGES